MLDHINITLFVLKPLVVDRFVLCLYDLHLLYISLSDTFESFLQEIPENEVHEPIHYEDCPVKRLWEHPKEAVITAKHEISVDFIGPSWLEDS